MSVMGVTNRLFSPEKLFSAMFNAAVNAYQWVNPRA